MKLCGLFASFVLVLQILPSTKAFATSNEISALCGDDPYEVVCGTPDLQQEQSKRKALLQRLSGEAVDQALLSSSQGGCGIKISTDPAYAKTHGEELKRDSVLLESGDKRLAYYGKMLQNKMLAYSHVDPAHSEFHSRWVGSDGKPMPESAQYNFLPAYNQFVGCFQNDYLDSFKDGPETQGPASQGIRKEIAEILGHAPNSVDMHMPELVADYWGTVNLERILAQTNWSPDEKLSILKQSFGNFCLSKADYEGGIHPTARFRVSLAMKSPGMRRAMGCAPLTAAEKPFCTL